MLHGAGKKAPLLVNSGAFPCLILSKRHCVRLGMSTELIGQRLTQLRKELVGPGEKKWSQAQVAEAAGLTRNIIVRLERLGAGGIDVLQTLLTFYYERGYNPSWVLMADNSRLSKRLPLDGVKTIPVTDVVTLLLQFQQQLHQQLDEMERDLLQ